MIEIKNLNKIYLKGKKNMVHALNNINLKIDDRETVAIIGESGAGKSTLLHIMSCIDNFDGEYYLDNIDINKLSESKKSKLRSSKIGIVLQDFALIDDFTVFENVMTPLYFNKKIKDKKSSVMRALKKTGIASLKSKKVSQLSGGQKQRVAISRALVTSPEYIFADEPTGSLDSKTSEEIVKMLFDLNRNGITIVIVTHNLEIANQCHHIIEIKDGNIIKDICS
ncbi:ABC transporter ATP-binding protein [Ruminococcus sp.]|uniref:ABC transporter ATP-binding protein n=1 Tax=Ruminococcus sp. TaxID=41978 RepID=UPI003AB8E0C2